MNEILPAKIERIEQELHDLGEAIEICKNPPAVKVDEGAYPALAETRRLLAEAQSREDAATRLAMLEDQLQGRRTELERLKLVLQSKQQTIETLKSEQAASFEQFKALEAKMLEQLKIAMAYSQAIAQEEQSLVQPCRPGVVFAANTTQINRLMDVSVTNGRTVLSIKSSGLFEFIPDGLGGHSPRIPDFQHLIKTEEQAA